MLGVHFGNGFHFLKVETRSRVGGVGDLFNFGFFVVADDGAVECKASHDPDVGENVRRIVFEEIC